MDDQIDPRLIAINSSLYRCAVKAVIKDTEGKLLLVKESDDEHWGIPGGGIDYGEDIHAALIRELKEEIGLDPKDIEIELTPVLVTNDGIVSKMPRLNIYYKVRADSAKVKVGEDVDFIKWCAKEDLKDMTFSPSLVNHIRGLIAQN